MEGAHPGKVWFPVLVHRARRGWTTWPTRTGGVPAKALVWLRWRLPLQIALATAALSAPCHPRVVLRQAELCPHEVALVQPVQLPDAPGNRVV